METKYDIAIIGSGISGSVLACILARQSLKVVVIDAGSHPKFAIGESMIPETGLQLKILAERYGLPELTYPATVDTLIDNVGSSSAGIKLAFSFAWNGAEQHHSPDHVTAPPLMAPEAHLFRQDVDYYYVALAARLGADIRQQTLIDDIIFDEAAELHLKGGDIVEADFVVDAAGFGSPVARKFGLRENAPDLETQSCAIFTHMTGVLGYEEIQRSEAKFQAPFHLKQSTLHHLFHEGWLWVIPFDNHPHATNQFCSIGLQFNLKRYKPTKSPAEEFELFLERHPTIARHFAQAARVREWTFVPRINFTSSSAGGSRYALLGHAAGFVDPLFSRGLANTFESINRLAPRLIDAAKNNRWSQLDLSAYKQYSREVIYVNDRLVANSYSAFDSFDLWNAWHRIWLCGSHLGGLRLGKMLEEFRQTGDNAALQRAFENARYPGHMSIDSDGFEALFDKCCGVIERKERGELAESDAIEELYELYNEYRPILPPAPYYDRHDHFITQATDAFAQGMLDWATDNGGDMGSLIGPRGEANVDFLDNYRYGSRVSVSRVAS